MKNQENISPPKDNNNPAIIEHKGIKSCSLADKEFKTAVLRKLNEL